MTRLRRTHIHEPRYKTLSRFPSLQMLHLYSTSLHSDQQQSPQRYRHSDRRTVAAAYTYMRFEPGDCCTIPADMARLARAPYDYRILALV
jgi:hypothetical protein